MIRNVIKNVVIIRNMVNIKNVTKNVKMFNVNVHKIIVNLNPNNDHYLFINNNYNLLSVINFFLRK